jgi:hypothetical protein
MNQQATFLTKTIFLATCLAFGCTSSGTLGCGSSGGGEEATVDSELLGIYEISGYQRSQEGCDQPMDTDPPADYLALYSFATSNDPDNPLLLGRFCNNVDDCRNDIRNFPAVVGPGYSFTQGNDETGWLGWAVSRRGNLNDQCQHDVQTHTLTSASAGEIDIETRTFQPIFPPTYDGDTATCRDADAIAALNDELPCVELFRLEAMRETGL